MPCDDLRSVPMAIAMVGTYPPTRCGLATFTKHTRDALIGCVPGDDIGIIRLASGDSSNSRDVICTWSEDDDPAAVARITDDYDVVVIQHEFGIYPGVDGDSVCRFVDAVDRPVITVLHTVLADESPRQRSIIAALAETSTHLVVLGATASWRLTANHTIDPDRIVVIPHGADLHPSDPTATDDPIWRPGRVPTVLTWGLLGPGKGLESALEAIAHLGVRGVPVRYVIAGQLHPAVIARQGDRYRRDLEQMTLDLGIGDRVVFDDRYRTDDELRQLIAASDAVLLPYESRDQVTSGVLVEALAAGKPVVATAFPHAVEVVTDRAGIVVPHLEGHQMGAALADGIEHLFGDRETYRRYRLGAHWVGEEHSWPRVGARYRELIGTIGSSRFTTPSRQEAAS